MDQTTVHEIALAISGLEEAISVARLAAAADPLPRPALQERLELYRSIVEKQWKLLAKLCFYLRVGNIVQATQSAKLINGLSVMIRDDAEDFVSSETDPGAPLHPEVMYC